MFSTANILSPGEIDYVTSSCSRNCRLDGRTCTQFRPYSLEVNVIPTASGSARIRIESANILSVVKLDVVSLKPGQTPAHLVNTSIDFKTPRSVEDKNALAIITASLSSEIKAFLLQSSLIKDDILTIIPDKQAWALSVDITVFSHCGNVFDMSLLATRAALATATIPALKVYRKFNKQTKQISEYQLELLPGSMVPLGIWDKHFPIPVSLCILGSSIIVDPSHQEESCIGSRYIVGYDRCGNVVGHTKIGVTGISPQLYLKSLEIAAIIGKASYDYYLSQLSRAINQSEKLSTIMTALYNKFGVNAPLPHVELLNLSPSALAEKFEKMNEDENLVKKSAQGDFIDVLGDSTKTTNAEEEKEMNEEEILAMLDADAESTKKKGRK